MYTLEEKRTLEDKLAAGKSGDLVGVKILCNGRIATELNGGISATVAAIYENLTVGSIRNQRSDDFLHGIVLAMAHCTVTGQVPVATVG